MKLMKSARHFRAGPVQVVVVALMGGTPVQAAVQRFGLDVETVGLLAVSMVQTALLARPTLVAGRRWPHEHQALLVMASWLHIPTSQRAFGSA